jgi:hypothetical protein
MARTIEGMVDRVPCHDAAEVRASRRHGVEFPIRVDVRSELLSVPFDDAAFASLQLRFDLANGATHEYIGGRTVKHALRYGTSDRAAHTRKALVPDDDEIAVG